MKIRVLQLQRLAIMSATTMQRAKTLIATAITELDKIPHDVSLLVHRTPTASAASTSSTPHPVERMTEKKNIMYQHRHPLYPPQKASTKKCVGMTADIPQPHF
jgi:hypothetical protein